MICRISIPNPLFYLENELQLDAKLVINILKDHYDYHQDDKISDMFYNKKEVNNMLDILSNVIAATIIISVRVTNIPVFTKDNISKHVKEDRNNNGPIIIIDLLINNKDDENKEKNEDNTKYTTNDGLNKRKKQ